MRSLEKNDSNAQLEELLASIALLEEEREILREQVVSLKQELAIANQEKHLLMQEIKACNKDLRGMSQSNYNFYQELLSERQAKQALEQELDETRRLASCKLPQIPLQIDPQMEKDLDRLWTQAQERRRESMLIITKVRKLRQQVQQERQLRQRVLSS